MIDYLRDFVGHFEAREQCVAPPGLARYDFLVRGATSSAPKFELMVVPDDAPPWHGAFFGGSDGVTRIANAPDPELLLAVAGGVAYAIPVRAPASYMVLPIRPVRDLVCAPGASLVILVGDTRLLAIGPKGDEQWRHEEPTFDGFTEVRLAASVLVVRGYDWVQGGEVEVSIDVRNGEVLARK